MFRILLASAAAKQFRTLPPKDKGRIALAIDGLAADPYVGKKLQGELSHYYSLRVWPYRIIYSIETDIVTVTVVAIGQRQGIYKRSRYRK
jgi:mRNA interferase RelE/StbE